MTETDYTDPATIDVDEVIANIIHAYRQRGHLWTASMSWPNVTVLALAAEVLTLRRQVEFTEILCDGAPLTVNGIPWREAFDRLKAIVDDPVIPPIGPRS